MPDGGVKTTQMPTGGLVDEVLANRAGSTVRVAVEALFAQLVESAAFADYAAKFGRVEFQPTFADAEAALVPPEANGLILLGRAASGDLGGGRYRRSAAEPAHPAKIRTGDLQWWEWVDDVLGPEHVGDVSGDCAAALAAALSWQAAIGRGQVLLRSAYGVASALVLTHQADIEGRHDRKSEIYATAAMDALLRVGNGADPASFVNIRDLKLDGRGFADAVLDTDGAQNTMNLRVVNLLVQGWKSGGVGIRLNPNSDDARFDHLKAGPNVDGSGNPVLGDAVEVNSPSTFNEAVVSGIYGWGFKVGHRMSSFGSPRTTFCAYGAYDIEPAADNQVTEVAGAFIEEVGLAKSGVTPPLVNGPILPCGIRVSRSTATFKHPSKLAFNWARTGWQLRGSGGLRIETGSTPIIGNSVAAHNADRGEFALIRAGEAKSDRAWCEIIGPMYTDPGQVLGTDHFIDAALRCLPSKWGFRLRFTAYREAWRFDGTSLTGWSGINSTLGTTTAAGDWITAGSAMTITGNGTGDNNRAECNIPTSNYQDAAGRFVVLEGVMKAKKVGSTDRHALSVALSGSGLTAISSSDQGIWLGEDGVNVYTYHQSMGICTDPTQLMKATAWTYKGPSGEPSDEQGILDRMRLLVVDGV